MDADASLLTPGKSIRAGQSPRGIQVHDSRRGGKALDDGSKCATEIACRTGTPASKRCFTVTRLISRDRTRPHASRRVRLGWTMRFLSAHFLDSRGGPTGRHTAKVSGADNHGQACIQITRLLNNADSLFGEFPHFDGACPMKFVDRRAIDLETRKVCAHRGRPEARPP
jgi:hypothetical protein